MKKIKTEAINIRVTPDEKKKLKKEADKEGTSLCKYVLERATTTERSLGYYKRQKIRMLVGIQDTINILRRTIESIPDEYRREIIEDVNILEEEVLDLWDN